jgi:amino acid transporter
MRTFRSVFSHLSIIFSGVFITLTILNQYNPGMGFLTSMVSSVFILLYCLTVLTLAIATIADNRHHARQMYHRAEEAARWKKISSNNQRPPQREE